MYEPTKLRSRRLIWFIFCSRASAVSMFFKTFMKTSLNAGKKLVIVAE